MRRQIDLKAAVDALTEPRVVHTTQLDPKTREPRIRSVLHAPLIDLLEQGTGTGRSPRGGAGSGEAPIPIDANALETWAQIREQVRYWLRLLRAPWADDLKTDLRTWHQRHEAAVAGGRVRDEHAEDIARLVEGWRTRIEAKYDPDERREWTEPCPAVVDQDERTGRTRRCGARRIMLDGVMQFAIALNVTRREAECRSCRQRWEGERELMSLRYETNLVEAERIIEREAAAVRAEQERAARRERDRDLSLTGPIELP